MQHQQNTENAENQNVDQHAVVYGDGDGAHSDHKQTAFIFDIFQSQRRQSIAVRPRAVQLQAHSRCFLVLQIQNGDETQKTEKQQQTQTQIIIVIEEEKEKKEETQKEEEKEENEGSTASPKEKEENEHEHGQQPILCLSPWNQQISTQTLQSTIRCIPKLRRSVAVGHKAIHPTL